MNYHKIRIKFDFLVNFRAKTEFWCEPEIQVTTEIWKNLSIPKNISDSHCFIYDIQWNETFIKHGESVEALISDPAYVKAVENSTVKPCSKFQFDRSFWKRTIIQVFRVEIVLTP